MHSFRPVLMALLAASALGGCSIVRHNTSVDATTELVGLSKSDLYACAGVPDRTAVIGSTEYVTFDNSEETSQSLTIPLIGGGASNQQTQFCRATAVLEGGKVVSLSYTGDSGVFYATDEQCSYSIRTCVKRVEDRLKQSKRP